jgi:hypothetical protein
MAAPFIYANPADEFSQLHQLLSKFDQPSLCAVTNIIHLQKLPLSYRGPNRGHAHTLRKYFRLHIFRATISPPPLVLRSKGARVSSFLRFLDYTQQRTTVNRTPLDERSARRRDVYLTTHSTHNRQTYTPPARFEPGISAGERPQTHALDRAATGTGAVQLYYIHNI